MKKLKIWWLAWICDYPFFRVTYKDGQRTHVLFQAEASGLKDVFGGKMWIDYEYAKDFLSKVR
jgi:hypothetical protein